MAGKSKKDRTRILLKQYLDEGRPWQLRNKIVMMHDKLICWVAKHYQVDGYAEFDDLRQEGVLAVIDFLENLLTYDNLKFYSVRFLVKCCQHMDKYRKTMMCSLSGEYIFLKQETNVFWNYIRQNKDEWTVDNLEILIRQHYEETYGKTIERLPTYFQKRIDPDEVAVEDKPYEIATSGEIIRHIQDKCMLRSHHILALNAYLLNPMELIKYGHGKTTVDALFAEVAWQRGVTTEAVSANYRKAVKMMQEYFDVYLVNNKMLYVDDIRELCSSDMNIHYLTNYQYESTFEDEYKRAFPEEFSYTPEGYRNRKAMVYKRRSM